MSDGLLRVKQLSKSLAGRDVLHEISLDVQRGEFLGLIGPNGAGKTTFLKCITGQWTVPHGCVAIDGIDVAADPLAAKAKFGFAFEPGDLIEKLTGRHHLKFISDLRRIASPEIEIRALAEMLEVAGSLDAEVGTYSHGTRQKLGIMMALMGHPPLVIMDESLSGLDPVVGFRMKNHLRELALEGRTGIILSSHMLESLEKYCTRIAMIREGRIFRIWTRAELEQEAEATGKHLEELFVELMGESTEPASVGASQ